MANRLFRPYQHTQTAVKFPAGRIKQTLKVFQATHDWVDCALCAEGTSMHWGKHSRQYLALKAGKSYTRLCASDAPEWWYVVENGVRDALESGGWAPPAFLRECGARIAFELQLPVRVRTELYVPEENP